LNEYRFETAYYNTQHGIVISLDITLQFLDAVTLPEYVPYLSENQYDRKRAVNEPSGSYTLHEESGPYRASDGADIFIKWYNNSSAGIY
jgi:hypothetical protein